MDAKLVENLIKSNEGPMLDFKTTFYDITEKKSKTDFVKDILAFSNSTLERNGYIICGVREDTTGSKEVVGIDKNLSTDDARWVQLLNSYSSHPIEFQIHKIHLEIYNRTVAVIEISQSQERPVLCTRDEGSKLQQGIIYFRNGSTNDITKDLVTLEKIISKHSSLHKDEKLNNDPTYNRYSKFPPAPYYKFIGRDTEIQQIHAELVHHHKNYLLSLTGDGGSGKTSIAYKVAEQIKISITEGTSDYDDVIWISAKDQRIYFDERRQLNREFNSIDDLLNKILLVFYDQSFILNMEKNKKEALVRQALAGTKFFFVLDNLEVFTQNQINEIYSFIKGTPSEHKFLLTSRHDLRVQEFIPIANFDEDNTAKYIEDIFIQFHISETCQEDLKLHFSKFYNLTNGNPLYIKYFLAQIKHGRNLLDIIDRRNLEGEKSLKAYCFDSTLNILTEAQLKIMYSLAVIESSYLSFNEIRFMTLLDSNTLLETIEYLCSVSMITREVRTQQVYVINGLLKSYLIEERRIPLAEFQRLHQKSRDITMVTKAIDPDFAFNFGLTSILNVNEIMSYNLILNNLNSISPQLTDEILNQTSILYPGNYLVPFCRNLTKIRNRNGNVYNIYTEINADFAHLDTIIRYDEEKAMMYLWKSILYMLIGKFNDVIKDLDYVESFYSGVYDSLISMTKASCLNMQAYEEYKCQRFSNHDELRNSADNIFTNCLEDFLDKKYFYFIKQNLCYAYNQHLKHMRRPIHSLDMSPFTPNIQGISINSLWTATTGI